MATKTKLNSDVSVLDPSCVAWTILGVDWAAP